MILLSNVGKSYGQIRVLSDVSLRVDEGEFVAIVGPSGSGKSTLMHMMGCLDKPTSGEVIVAGKNVARMSDGKSSEFRNKKIGFVFQSFYLQPFLTVAENVMVPMMFAGCRKSQMEERVKILLRQVGLEECQDYIPSKLSGGQIQRVAIARALVNNPEIILADEPTGNLDTMNGQRIMSLFERIRNNFGTTVVVVTHDMEIARKADRIIEIRDGRIGSSRRDELIGVVR